MSPPDLPRRRFLYLSGVGLPALLAGAGRANEASEAFMAEAERMRRVAIEAGDQPYGAVIVRDGVIIGYGASRVVADRDPDAHAERVALRDAQRRVGSQGLGDATIYSTSQPCAFCQRALAAARVGRMFHGPGATDGGPPRG